MVFRVSLHAALSHTDLTLILSGLSWHWRHRVAHQRHNSEGQRGEENKKLEVQMGNVDKREKRQRSIGGLTLGAGGPWSFRYVDSPGKTGHYKCKNWH